MDETRSNPETAGQFAQRWARYRSIFLATPRIVVAAGMLAIAALLPGCQTDHVAQNGINQMRAEKLALEDRYASLRNEYEKLSNRLAAQGDPESRNPSHPSALPLVYPPGPSPLDIELNDPIGGQAWSLDETPELNYIPGPQRAPIPQLGSGRSVLEPPNPSAMVPTATPTRIQLVDQQTRLTPGTSPNSFVLRIVSRATTEQGEPASPVGTYTLRLIDPRGQDANSMLGTWQFPTEKIRSFAANSPAEAAKGVPLEVTFSVKDGSPPELVAEIEFHPVVGKKLTCRGFVGGSSNGNGQVKPWIDTLPVPKDARGLMRTNNAANQEPSANLAPAWSPVR
ncbi:MAG: hypothetical protein Q8M16_21140 [Pirellulaceae bacterium]|nr:hypothetical protein [Pirellulaceae bacterium]